MGQTRKAKEAREKETEHQKKMRMESIKQGNWCTGQGMKYNMHRGIHLLKDQMLKPNDHEHTLNPTHKMNPYIH